MTHPPATSEWPADRIPDGLAKLPSAIPVDLEGASPSLPNTQAPGFVMPSDTNLVDQSGRPLGTRAQRTRTRILDATISLLDEKSMRDLRVIDIARRIGSSPATFYQYFKDVNDVVLELATRVSDLTPEMIELIHGDWSGTAGHELGRRLANLVTDHWDQYKAILRVRNNAADEGDPAFREVRMKAMLPMLTAFAQVIEAGHPASDESESVGSAGGRIHPFSGAMFLFTALESMASHHEIFEKRFEPMTGEGREALIETIATILQSTLDSPR